MAQPIFTANLDLLVTGIMPGVNEEHVPLWIKAYDVMMENSGLRPIPGLVRPYVDNGFFDGQNPPPGGLFENQPTLFDETSNRVFLDAISSEPVKGIHVQKQSDGRLLAVWGTDTALFAFDSTGVTNATRTSRPYSGNSSPSDIVDETHWSFAQWGDWVIATNGVDKPQVLKYPTLKFADLTGFPCDSAQHVRVLGPHLLALNLTGVYAPTSTAVGPNEFCWCKADDIEEWNPGVAPTAGLLPIRDFAGPIIAAEHLGNVLLAYGESTVHVIEYGGQFLFTANKGAIGVRAVSKNSVAPAGAQHIVLTQNGILACDGQSFRQLAYPALGAWLEDVVDWTQRSRIVHVVDVRRSNAMWTLPGVEQDFVLVYNWLSDKITTASRPFTAGTRVESLWRPLCGFFNGDIRMMIDTPNDRAPELITKPLLVANRTMHSFMDAVVGRWSGGAAQVQIKYGENQNELDSLPWQSLGSFSVRENILWAMREAMFVQLRISSGGVKWLLTGIELIGKQGGGRL